MAGENYFAPIHLNSAKPTFLDMNEGIVSLDKLLNGNGIQDASVKIPNSTNTQKTSDSIQAKTLEAYHLQNLSKIREEEINLSALKSQLSQKREQFRQLDSQFDSPMQSLQTLTAYSKLEKEINDLEDKIHKIESGQNEVDYFLRVGNILFSYTDAQDQIALGKSVKDQFSKKRMPANSVYSYFATESPIAPESEPELQIPIKASHLDTTIGFQRDKALESYLSSLDPNNVQHDSALISTIEENYGTCPVCDSEMLFNETFLDCSECGHRDYILVDSEKPSYKDPPREMSYYAYKKINHLNECLAQFQAKETTEIPTAVLEQIRTELRKERITDMSKLKPSKLKEVLKKLKLSRCYDHVAHILNRLNGISAPVLSREVEEKLRSMFKEIQFSFVKHCPKKRSNFLSYSYVLYKFCELMELDEYLPCFPLLKSREKLYMQDKIWQLICTDMGWEFIRTV